MFGLHMLARSESPPIIPPGQRNRVRNRYNARVVSTMSNRLPFIAVEYKDRRIAIRRDADYDHTISLVKDAFPLLSGVPAASIVLTAALPEFNMYPVEIGQSVWQDALPEIAMVQVLLVGPENGGSPSKKRKSVGVASTDPNTNAKNGMELTWDT